MPIKNFMYTVHFKDGVPTDTLQSVMRMYMYFLAYIHFTSFNKYMCVTSTTDGKHSKKSLHYKGLAIDIRTFDKTFEETNRFVNFIKFHFDKILDVVLENDHIHVEYDPK